MCPSVSDEILDQMRDSDHVTIRAQGVIATWLRSWVRNHPENLDEIAAAKDLTRSMTAAGLATFIDADLRDFIEQIQKRRRESAV